MRKEIKYGLFPIVCAGTQKGNEPLEEKSASIKINNFLDKEGNALNPKNFLQFVVSGNSMKFCGIYDKDLIFVKKGFRITDLDLDKFPYILVIKNADSKPDEPNFKLRRAWGIARYNENNSGDKSLIDVVNKTMQVPKFKVIRDLEENGEKVYAGDEETLKDFRNIRLPNYISKYITCENPDNWNQTVVISTTYDTRKEKVHFSIHPIANIVGIVSEVYGVNEQDSNTHTPTNK